MCSEYGLCTVFEYIFGIPFFFSIQVCSAYIGTFEKFSIQVKSRCDHVGKRANRARAQELNKNNSYSVRGRVARARACGVHVILLYNIDVKRRVCENSYQYTSNCHLAPLKQL